MSYLEVILCDGFGVHILLSQVGPKLEAETKIRKAVNYGSSSGHFRLNFIWACCVCVSWTICWKEWSDIFTSLTWGWLASPAAY